MICYAQLNLHLNNSCITELRSISDTWQPHLNVLQYSGEWEAISLRSPGGKNTTSPDLMGEEQFMDTGFMNSFPSVQQLIKSLYCPVMSVRLLKLKPGSTIKPHKDLDLAFEHGEARLHFPIVTNTAVEFYVEDERITMQEGDCWYINANLPHSAKNLGETDRVHLVIDCKVNDWLATLFTNAAKKEKEVMPDYAREMEIMEALKAQGTARALEMASEIENRLIASGINPIPQKAH